MPKPPVPAVPKAVVRASNTGIPPHSKNTISVTVITKYMIYNIRAVWRILGTSLPTDGPGLSAFIKFMLEPPDKGTTASKNTRTPIPPIQWVKLRQNKPQWDIASTSSSMLAPVVVNPDIVSKRASVMLGISPVI